jgi:hypothetical protein
MKICAILVMLLALMPLTLLSQGPPVTGRTAVDADADRLDDNFEQQLLERFRPEFMISKLECDVAPAVFAPGKQEPLLRERNGTIYGQVFPHSREHGPSVIEIHYYHLWSRDCARFGHALDAEHVAALVNADAETDKADAYKALYWYAAAHEKTQCDGSSGAKATSIQAESRGPKVWVSAGKHASFLKKECTGACGADRCDDPAPMIAGPLINLGEPTKPLNGADWAASTRWPLSAKMQAEFTEPVIAELSAAEGIVPVNSSSRVRKGVIRRAGITADAIETGNAHTEDALATGAEGAATGVSSTKSSLRRAARAVGRWFGRGTPAKK